MTYIKLSYTVLAFQSTKFYTISADDIALNSSATLEPDLNTTNVTETPISKGKPVEETSVFIEHKWEFILLIAVILVIILGAVLQLTNYRMLRRSGEPNNCLQSRPRCLRNKPGPTVPPCVGITNRDLIPVVEL